MRNFWLSFKTPYDTIADVIEEWCQKNYYGNFLVTLRINGELCTEYLIYETGDPDRLDPYWVWESDWWEGQKDVELVGFTDISSVRVSGTPDNYKFITIDKEMLTENICCNCHWYEGVKAVAGTAPCSKHNKQVLWNEDCDEIWLIPKRLKIEKKMENQ